VKRYWKCDKTEEFTYLKFDVHMPLLFLQHHPVSKANDPVERFLLRSMGCLCLESSHSRKTGV
ncbi:MAG TPA: hypothetical protein PLK61_08045, partial [Nitrosomonas sp.]|nr:hypothetical protein [Nitrosomonas sp.]